MENIKKLLLSPKCIPIYNLLFFSLTCTIILVYLQFLFTHSHYNSDFRAFYTGAHIIRQQPHQLYDLEFQVQYQQTFSDFHNQPLSPTFLPFLNPPLILLPLIPLTLLPYTTAYCVGVITLISLFMSSLYLLFKIFPINNKYQIYIALATLTFGPVYFTLFHTQNAIISLMLVLTAIFMHQKKRLFLTGLCLGLLWYKPQIAFIFTLYTLFFNQHPRIIAGNLTGITLHGLPFLVYQINPLSYLQTFIWYATSRENLPHNIAFMISWQGFFRDLLIFMPQFPFRMFSFIFSFCTILITFIVIHRSQQTKNILLSLLVIIPTTLLSGLHIHYSEALLLLIPIFYFVSINISPNILIISGIGWVIFLLTIFSPFYPQGFPFASVLFTILIWIMSLKLLLTSKLKHLAT